MVQRPVRVHTVRPSVLIVGEGYAEFQLLRYVRSLYTADNRGCKLQIGNARGKGAAHVIDYTIRQSRQADYRQVAALLDTDTDWTREACENAQKHGIVLLPSEPCLEAWLLAVVGIKQNASSQGHKARFKHRFGGDAADDGLIERHFSKQMLDAARPQIAVLDKMLGVIGV